MIKVELSKSAEKNLLKLPKHKQKLIARKLLILKSDPFLGKPLSGKLKGTLSIRVWPYRIVYEFNPKTKNVMIYKIQHRKEVYRD